METKQVDPSRTPTAPDKLLKKLAEVLPKSANFQIYHLSTPPTKTSSLYSAPPNTRPDRTYCESHFLNVAIRVPSTNLVAPKNVLIFAIEILIYSTAYDTTIFVSKADSTGYLHLLNLPKGTPSPIRTISVTFLQHLLKQRQRANIRSVVSLFARAQDQYLFPGSVEYSGKHVLDDRGLVKWWCRVLDPLISDSNVATSDDLSWNSVKGYLIVPGLDTYETSSYPPRRPGVPKLWTVGHPLHHISRRGADIPPRCLIPHYPDDPKARYLDELDDEITKGNGTSDGQWKSVRSIDQFWEMMAFRQECSAGRLVGFIWIVFEPRPQSSLEKTQDDSQATVGSDIRISDANRRFKTAQEEESPATSFCSSSQAEPQSSPVKTSTLESSISVSEDIAQSQRSRRPKPKKQKLTGPIQPRQPRIKTHRSSAISNIPESTPHYTWRPSGRGQVVVPESDYKRITELLLRLDFADLDLATSSTARWINEVKAGASTAEAEGWGTEVVGTKVPDARNEPVAGDVTTLNVGLVRKKRKPDAADQVDSSKSIPILDSTKPAVNVLGAGMIRKKPKA